MEEIKVTEEYNNMRIDRFLLRHFYKWSAIWIFKMIRLQKICLNKKHCRPSSRVFNGDVIQIDSAAFASWVNQHNHSTISKSTLMKINGTIDLLYEDNNIAIIKKNPNIETQSSISSRLKNIQNYFLKFLWLKGQYNVGDDFVPSICNRLDRNTSGLIMAAKNFRAQQLLHDIIKKREVDKFYWCLVSRKPFHDHVILSDFLYNDKNTCKVFVSHTRQNMFPKRIITEFKVLRTDGKLFLLDVKLITGRTHQIRAHSAFYEFPIVGDRKYGNGEYKNFFPYQALHNYQIKFNLSSTDHLLGYLNQKTFIWKDAWFLKKPYWNEN